MLVSTRKEVDFMNSKEIILLYFLKILDKILDFIKLVFLLAFFRG